jgi:AbiU2
MIQELRNFSHLEPTERLLVARHRIGMLSKVLVEVLKLDEQAKAFISSRLRIAEQDDDAVEVLFQTIIHYEIAQICRLWDDIDPLGFSIPTIVDLIKGVGVREILSSPENPEGPSKELLECFDAAIKTALEVEASAQLLRIKNYRHKFIAHPIFQTRQEIKRAIMSIQAHDMPYAVENALSTVEIFETALSIPPRPDYLLVRTDFADHVRSFYQRLKLDQE